MYEYGHLAQLDNYEALGKLYHDTFQKNLSYGQFLTLLAHYGSAVSIELLNSAVFREKQAKIESSFHTDTHGVLSEDGFFQENAAIEVERLARYIDIPAHRHNFVECSYVLQGQCTQTVSGNPYVQQAGTFSVINSFADHHIVADPDCICLTIKVRHNTFLDLKIPSLPVFASPVYVECGDDPFIRDRVLELHRQQQEKPPHYELMMENIFTSILLYFCQAYRDSLHYFITGAAIKEKMLAIYIYMYENYQTVTLHSLAQHFHYSDAYLSNLFRETSNSTFTETLRLFKLEQAKNLLLSTKLKQSEICDRVGFRDHSRFIRDFKKQYCQTPAQYRKTHTETI